MATEKRLIDANALMDALGYDPMKFLAITPESTFGIVLNAPTVDAVEVVRCKDCWKSADGLCSYHFKNVPGKDFCGDGERKIDDI